MYHTQNCRVSLGKTRFKPLALTAGLLLFNYKEIMIYITYYYNCECGAILLEKDICFYCGKCSKCCECYVEDYYYSLR